MTLTQTAALTKQIIVVSILTLISSIIVFVGYNIWYANYLASLPPIEEKPDLRFGALPQPNFPTSTVSSSNFSYSLDTVTGSLPDFGKIIKVYYIPKSYATLLSGEKSQQLAKNFGITNAPKILSETLYSFEQDEKALTVNLDTGNFLYTGTASVSGQILKSDADLVNDFQNQIRSLTTSTQTFGRSKVTVLNESTAEISLWPQAIEKKEIFTPNFNKSLISSVVIQSAKDIKNYKSFDYIDWPIDTTTFATYPLKTPEQAFDNLKSGQGVIIIPPSKPQVSISSVYLGYYLSEDYNQYLLPIYIFEGPGFVSYVAAIDSTDQTPTN